jgi:TadE-like protein
MRLLPAHRESAVPRRGQAMVEFALVLPLLAVLLVMAVDFGRVFFGWVALQNATRIAADFAASHPDSWPGSTSTHAQNRDRYQDIVLGDLGAINCDRPPGPVPDPTFPDGTETGDPAVVELTCSFQLITPLAETLLGGPVPLGAQASFPVNRNIQLGLPPPAAPDPPPPVPSDEPEPSDPLTCSVPDFDDERKNDAQGIWEDDGGFTTTVTFLPGTGNYRIHFQSLAPGTEMPCDTAVIQVGP